MPSERGIKYQQGNSKKEPVNPQRLHLPPRAKVQWEEEVEREETMTTSARTPETRAPWTLRMKKWKSQKKSWTPKLGRKPT